MATIDLMDRFGNLGSGGIRNNGTLDAEAMFQPSLRTMRTDFIQVKAGDSIVYKNMSGMSSIWNILSFYTGDAQGFYVSGIAGQTTPQSGVWTASQDGYVRLFGSFPAGDNISVTMTDLAPDVEDYLAKYNAMNYRFLPNSIPKIVAHIQEYLSNHPIADSTTLQAVIDEAFKSYLEEIQETADTYIAEAVPPAAAAAVDAAASPALAEITAKTAEAAESAREAGLSQQSAEMSEQNALTYRNQAQQIKDSITAEVSASVQAAQEQATLAQESAQAADESANTADQYVAQARAQAEAAADHAQTASGYASDAQGYMQDASDFADNAAQSAATFTTDPTLTISGKAADAKAAGDQLSDLKSHLKNTNNVLSDVMGTNMISVPYEVSAKGKAIRVSTGELYTVSTMNATDFIDISAYDFLIYDRITAMMSTPLFGMAFYDATKTYIIGYRATTNASATGYSLYDLQIPDNAVYARFSILADAETYGSFSLYGKSKLQKTVDDTTQNSDILAFKELVDVPYHIMGYSAFVKFIDGTTSSSTIYAYTDYVDVSRYSRIKYKSIADKTSAPTHGMAFYDADKNFIRGTRSKANFESLQYAEVLTDVPKNAKYARFTVFADSNTYGNFALWGTGKLYDLADIKSPYEKNVLIAQVAPEWYRAQGDSYEGFTINTLYSEIIAAWDELLANSKGYITKDEIGTASDGQKMYCYKLIPTRYRKATGSSVTNNAPVFLIVPSIHGYEKSAAYGTYYFARDLVYNFNKNAVLNSLRTKCIIYVIPVGNPWGFDNKQRKNANGVDCNRNWGPDPSGTDDPSSQYYPGAEPFDQPETQAIKNVIDTTENLFYVVDYHTNGQYKAASWADVNWITWGTSVVQEDYSARAYVASQFQVSDISENLPMEYELDTNDQAIGSITLGAAGAPRPTISYYTRTALNILGGTFEGNNGLPIESDSAYSALEQKINSELIGNWIKNLMLIYKNID